MISSYSGYYQEKFIPKKIIRVKCVAINISRWASLSEKIYSLEKLSFLNFVFVSNPSKIISKRMRFDFAVSPNNWVEGRESISLGPKACKLIPKNSRGRENVISVSQGKLTIYLCWGGTGAKTVSIDTKGSSQTSTSGVKQSDILIIATIFWPMGFLSSGFEKGETTYESGCNEFASVIFYHFSIQP